MSKLSGFLIVVLLNGCAIWPGTHDENHQVFYESKAALETQCKNEAHSLYPGYPARRGVLTNYWFTRAYEQCMQKTVVN